MTRIVRYRPNHESLAALRDIAASAAPAVRKSNPKAKSKAQSHRSHRPIMDVKTIPAAVFRDRPDKSRVTIAFDINPAIVPTAQQKGVDFKHGLMFTKSYVRHTEDLFRTAISPHAADFAHLKDRLLRITATFLFPYPKSTAKCRLLDLAYFSESADLDNLWKGLGDAFTRSGVWNDDRQIADLRIHKIRTTSRPAIVVSVEPAPHFAPEDLMKSLVSAQFRLSANDAPSPTADATNPTQANLPL